MLSSEIATLEAENAALRAALLASGTEPAAGLALASAAPVESEEPAATTVVRAEIKREEDADEVTFWFVDADFLRTSQALTLPSHKTLQRMGALRRHTLSKHRAYQSGYAASLLAVSHRWEDQRAPDSLGVQMAAIKAHVAAHPSVQAVWYDYWS